MRIAGTIRPSGYALTLLLLCACASAPTSVEMSNADYGRDVTPQDCVRIVEEVIANALRDPGSAQFRHTQCERGYWTSVPILGMPVAFGWWQRGEVNGKNAYGGYVGFRPYQVLMKDGAAIRYCIADHNGICSPTGR